MHWDILDQERQALLPALSLVKAQGFYLAGGTALALQLGHRTSIDFDFYTASNWHEILPLETALRQVMSFTTDHIADGTLIGHCNTVELSFFRYQYPLIAPLIDTDSLHVAAVADIAAMKMVALSQRGLRRDFIDIHAIATQYGMREVFAWTQKKFPQLDAYILLRALTYFEDADSDPADARIRLLQPVEWSQVKQYCIAAARELGKTLL